MIETTTAFVKIWGEIVGAVLWDKNTNTASFEYMPNFKNNNWELAPIKMPLSKSTTIFSFPELKPTRNDGLDTFKGLPGLLADILPDRYGNELINTWLAKEGRPLNSLNPIEQLCFIGTRGMGALEFEPTYLKKEKNAFKIELDGLIGTAEKILTDKIKFKTNITENEEKAITEILKIGTSAGGARPKAIISYNKKTGEIKSGQTNAPKNFEQWIIKLDGIDNNELSTSKGYGKVEMAYYNMAIDCKIEMMPSMLFEENTRSHFMTKRFDRGENNVKHHTQTFCAIQHFDFNNITSYSYEQLFQTMQLLRLPYPQFEQMYRRMVFNVLAKNCDDHTKNFSFMLKKEADWELAPAYDICYAYSPDNIWISQHALSINGKRFNINKNDLLLIAKSFSIKKAENIFKQIKDVVSKWPKYAHETRVPENMLNRINETIL